MNRWEGAPGANDRRASRLAACQRAGTRINGAGV